MHPGRALLAAALALLLGLSGCGDDEPASGGTLAVYVSVPREGEQGRQVIAGVKSALAGAGGRVGEYEVRAYFRFNDPGGEGFDPVAVAENARRATEDSTTIGYIGDMSTGATSVSLPITNQADIVQIDPGLSGSFLSRPIPGQPDPDRFRPSEERTFLPLYPANNNVELCGDYTDLGYEAAQLLLDAVDEVGANRDEVVTEILGTRDRRSRIGTYTLNANNEVILEGKADCP